MKLVSYMLRPFVAPVVLYRVAKTMTSEERALLRSDSLSETEKDELALQITQRAFPNLEIV